MAESETIMTDHFFTRQHKQAFRRHFAEIILVGSIICMGAVFIASLNEARQHEIEWRLQ